MEETMVLETGSAAEMLRSTAKLSMAAIEYDVRAGDDHNFRVYVQPEYAFEASDRIMDKGTDVSRTLETMGAQAEREVRMAGMGPTGLNGIPHHAGKGFVATANSEYVEPTIERDREIGEDMHRAFGKWSTPVIENGTSHQVNEAAMELKAVKIDSYIRVAEDGKQSLHVPSLYIEDAQKELGLSRERTLEMQPVSAMGRSR